MSTEKARSVTGDSAAWWSCWRQWLRGPRLSWSGASSADGMALPWDGGEAGELPRGRVGTRVAVLLVLSVACCWWIGKPGFLPDLIRVLKFGVRFSVFVGLAMGFTVAWLCKNRAIHWLSTLLLSACLCLEISYRAVTRHGFTYESAWLLVTAPDAISATVQMYWKLVLPGVAVAVLATMAASIALRRYVFCFNTRWTALSVLFIGAMIARTCLSGESSLGEYPLPFPDTQRHRIRDVPAKGRDAR